MQKEYPKNLQFYFFKYSKLIFPCRNRHSAWSIALVCVKIHPIQTRPIFAYLIQNFHNRAFTQKQHKAKPQHDLCFVRNKINQSISYKRHLSCFTTFSLLDIDYMQKYNTNRVLHCRILSIFSQFWHYTTLFVFLSRQVYLFTKVVLPFSATGLRQTDLFTIDVYTLRSVWKVIWELVFES